MVFHLKVKKVSSDCITVLGLTCVSPLVLYEVGPHVVRLAATRVRADDDVRATSIACVARFFTKSLKLVDLR